MRERAVRLVVHQHVVCGDATLAHGHDFELEFPRLQAQSAILPGPEEQRLPVLHVDLCVRRDVLRREGIERPIVENHAVLEHFDERRAAVRAGALQHAHKVRLQRVHRTRHEPRPGAEREGAGRDGVVD